MGGDMRDGEFLSGVLADVKPAAVIHCAAMVDVEQCERDPDGAFAMNARLPGLLARALPSECVFVYISTDSVFAGGEPCSTENTVPNPRTIYAQSKLAGEQEVEKATDNHLIVRTNFYGWSSRRKKTYAEWLYDSLRREQPLTLFSDVYFTPIYVVDLVERIRRLLEGPHRGCFHVAGRDRVSKYQFGELLARSAGLSLSHAVAASIDSMSLHAPRPKDTSLSSGQFCRCTGLEAPACAEGIRRFVSDQELPLSLRCTPSRTPTV